MTAIDWLLEQTMYIRSTKWPDIVEQAKAMEQQQHGHTWNDAITAFKGRGLVESRALCDFDEYYEATYGRHSE